MSLTLQPLTIRGELEETPWLLRKLGFGPHRRARVDLPAKCLFYGGPKAQWGWYWEYVNP